MLTNIRMKQKRCVVESCVGSRLKYNARNRAILIDWLSEFCCEHSLQRYTLHLALHLMDRFLLKCGDKYVETSNLQLVGVAAILVSLKYNVFDLLFYLRNRRVSDLVLVK